MIKNKLIKNFLYLFSGTTLSSIIGIFNTALLVKALGLENNGIIFLGLSYAGFFNALFNFQSFEAVIKFLPNCMTKNNSEGKNIIKQALYLDFITAIFALIVAIMFMRIAAEYLKWDLMTVKVAKILVYSIFFTIPGCFIGILRIFEKFKYMSMIELSLAISNTIIYSVGLFLNQELIYYVYGTIALSFINLLITMFLTYKTLKENEMHQLNIFKIKFQKEFIKFTIYTNLSSTLDLPIFQLTPFIINKYLGVSDVAVYKLLEKIGELIKRVTSIMGQSIMPEISKRLAKNDCAGAKRIGVKLGKIILSVGCLGIIFIALTKVFWLHWFIPNYLEYTSSLYFYVVFVVFTQTFIAQHPLFIYSGYVKENTLLLLIVNPFYIFLLFSLAKNFGLNGIIVSRIIQAGIIYIAKGVIFKLKK
ncbi:oligosaccharide flippase family protein [uncultured Cetobacterium sp.]|uniref:lipopolysaccharide biosynthesis protein n=1 Tax=uncultured Cetobacterium sp. TaxID=527638 RepID=UPI0025FE3BAA|nr:oligosaccharide flippase family protein [uncultured Cetobacterium sp.]